jgi:hypothetical protein
MRRFAAIPLLVGVLAEGVADLYTVKFAKAVAKITEGRDGGQSQSNPRRPNAEPSTHHISSLSSAPAPGSRRADSSYDPTNQEVVSKPRDTDPQVFHYYSTSPRLPPWLSHVLAG